MGTGAVSRRKFDRNQKIVWYRILILCCGACPGLRALLICLRCRNKSKNRDKQLTLIVRVGFSFFGFFSQFQKSARCLFFCLSTGLFNLAVLFHLRSQEDRIVVWVELVAERIKSGFDLVIDFRILIDFFPETK
jgi:hypothetical protein